MESLVDTAACFIDELLDFTSDVGEDDPSSSTLTADNNSNSLTLSASFPAECVEEELEWISNKDAFPSVDTFVDTITVSTGAGCKLKYRSPVSVLESITNSSGCNYPNTRTIAPYPFGFTASVRRARTTKGKRRHIQQLPLWIKDLQENLKTNYSYEKKASMKTNYSSYEKKAASYNNNTIGRKCQHCQTEKTPQWRAGPNGAKTLCNACGVRYKSGRLVPEYRPANSPTFSSKLHSNSHRKVVEIRRQKEAYCGSTGVLVENVVEMSRQMEACRGGSTFSVVDNGGAAASVG